MKMNSFVCINFLEAYFWHFENTAKSLILQNWLSKVLFCADYRYLLCFFGLYVMFFALYIQIIRHRCVRASKNAQIIRHRCVLPASTLPKQKAPPASRALKCSFVAHRASLFAHRASRSWRARGARVANQKAYSSSRAAAISSVMFMVL